MPKHHKPKCPPINDVCRKLKIFSLYDNNGINAYRANFFNSISPASCPPDVDYNGDWGILEFDPTVLCKLYCKSEFFINVVRKTECNSVWSVKNLRVQTKPENDYPAALIKLYGKYAEQNFQCNKLKNSCSNKLPVNITSNKLNQLLNSDVDKVQTYFALDAPTSTTFLTENKLADDKTNLSIFLSCAPITDANIIAAIVYKLCNFTCYDLCLKLVNTQGDIDESVTTMTDTVTDTSGSTTVTTTTTTTMDPPPTTITIGPPPKQYPLPIVPHFDPDFPLLGCNTVVLPFASNKHAAFNQCVSMAHSNCLDYLNRLHGFTNPSVSLPKPHVEGMRPDSTWSMNTGGDNSLVGLLDSQDYMNRQNPAAMITRSSGANVDGVNRTQHVAGLFRFISLNMANFPVSGLEHAGGSPNYNQFNVNSNRTSDNVTFEWVLEKLNQGKAVFMSFGRYSDPELNNWTSGHAVRIVGASQCGDQKTIKILDDEVQTNDSNGLRQVNWDVSKLVESSDAGGNVNTDQVGRMRLNGTDWIVLFSFAYSLDAPFPQLGSFP